MWRRRRGHSLDDDVFREFLRAITTLYPPMEEDVPSSRNATPTEITTDDKDMITYDMEEEELEQDPFILPEGYLRALTPSRYRNYRE
ncbi:hypothetical protein TNCV_4531791 [Trichonephila clavipes]|nr:hypothetical protein TNCV_4531791 [Trichonephila clavipes]